MNRTRLSLLVVLLTALSASACRDEGVQPVADGVYTIDLVAPAGHENGAVLIEVTGTGIADIAPIQGRLWSEATPTGARVLLMTAFPGPLRFTVRLEDAPQLPEATIVEVADIDNRVRGSLEGYSVRVLR